MSDIYTAWLCWLVGISCVCMFSYNPCFNSFSLFHRPSFSLRFHLLDEFDDAKKSCRKRLADHNRRRRKSKPSDADAGDKKRAHANKAAAAKDSTWYICYTRSLHSIFLFLLLLCLQKVSSFIERLDTQRCSVVHDNMNMLIYNWPIYIACSF